MEECGVQISSEIFMFHSSKVVRRDKDSDIIYNSTRSSWISELCTSHPTPGNTGTYSQNSRRERYWQPHPYLQDARERTLKFWYILPSYAPLPYIRRAQISTWRSYPVKDPKCVNAFSTVIGVEWWRVFMEDVKIFNILTSLIFLIFQIQTSFLRGLKTFRLIRRSFATMHDWPVLETLLSFKLNKI